MKSPSKSKRSKKRLPKQVKASELREDGGTALREDGGTALREDAEPAPVGTGAAAGAGAAIAEGAATVASAGSMAGLPLAARLRSLAPSSSSVTEAVAVADTVSATVTLAAVSKTVGERPAEIRDAARALSQEFTAQVEELQRSRPNEQDRLANHNELVAFFEKMAAGLSNLADAIDEAMNNADGKIEPAFLGRTAEVVRELQLGAMEWLEKNRMTVFEVPFRIGLFGLGLTFMHALGFDSGLVTTLIAGLALKQASKKSTHGRGPATEL